MLLSKLDGDTQRPLFMKRFFQVVALDKKSRDALSKSPNGEVVLPQGEMAQRKGLGEPYAVGELVILNGVLSQRYPRGFDKNF